jgi:cytochrome P450
MDPSNRLASMVLVTKYDEAAELLLRAREVYQSKQNEAEYLPLKRDTLTVLAGEAHNDRRRMETALFARAQLLRFEHSVLQESLNRQLARLARQSVGPGEALRADLLRLSRFTLLPVTSALVGLDVQDNDEWWERLSEFVRLFGIASALQWKEGDIEQERAETLQAAVDFDAEIFTPAWDRRVGLIARYDRGELAREDLPQDLITALLAHLPGRPRDVILREVILFFNASTDTSTMAVATAIFHLSEWLQDHPEDHDLLGDYGFVQRVAFEAIRLHPPPGLIRSAAEDIVLADGRRIPGGKEIFIDLKAVNADVDVFGPDAAQFNPHRDLPAGVKPYAHGFGGGAHKCIGRPLAMSHDTHDSATSEDGAIGAVVRFIRRLLELGVQLDPANPPTVRTGNRQERFATFPILLTEPSALAQLQDA